MFKGDVTQSWTIVRKRVADLESKTQTDSSGGVEKLCNSRAQHCTLVW